MPRLRLGLKFQFKLRVPAICLLSLLWSPINNHFPFWLSLGESTGDRSCAASTNKQVVMKALFSRQLRIECILHSPQQRHIIIFIADAKGILQDVNRPLKAVDSNYRRYLTKRAYPTINFFDDKGENSGRVTTVTIWWFYRRWFSVVEVNVCHPFKNRYHNQIYPVLTIE